MKGFLLAAGKGTRLKPITNYIPKCLVPIQGKPLIEYWFDLFKKYEIDEILINIHHLSDKVIDYLNKVDNGIKIKWIYEQELLGSAGTVVANQDFIKDVTCFWVFYADVLIDIKLEEMKNYHFDKNADMTIAVYESTNPKNCGVVEMDKDARVINFVEKPKKTFSNMVNAGIYLINTSIVDKFPSVTPLDFGYDILPQINDKIYAFPFLGYISDIGTIQNYICTNKEVQKKGGLL